VFETRGGVRLAFQLSLGEAAPLLILGGGQTGREQACNSPGGAEHPAWAEHTVLILDRTNTGASDVAYRGGPEVDEQVADLAELLDHLNAIGAVCRPWIMIGHSSGGRMLGRLAFKRPGLVHAAALLILTGGHTAATELGEQYYHSYARAAAEADGTLAVLKTPLYAALCESNTRSLDRLRHMPAQAFIAAMRASADFLLATRDAPALGLPAAELRRLGENTPLFVCNYFGQGEHDGMHTAAASRAVAEAAGQRQCELVVSADPKVWLEGLVHFVRRNAGTSREV
jgi:pimeloyl-ACP methyl ester carboxylesterase